jgi:hypothetical protein
VEHCEFRFRTSRTRTGFRKRLPVAMTRPWFLLLSLLLCLREDGV